MSKVAIVTGGTKGIGRAVVEKFASNGFDIAMCSRSEKDLGDFKLELDSKFNVNVLAVPVDVSQKNELKKFADKIINWNNNLHVLVNNAGIFLPGKVSEESDGTLESLMSTNTYSAYYLTRYVLNAIIGNKGAYIFNICSTASVIPYANGGSYCISKHAMLGFSKVLREELKEKGVRVSAVMPGATFTNSWEGSGLPESRFIKSNDIAEIIWSAYGLSENAVIEELIVRPQLGDI